MHATLRKVLPADAAEKIAYGIPTFTWHGNLVHFAGWKKHVGLYPGGSVLAEFSRELAGYTSSRGSVQFPLDQPLPVTLITRIVKRAIQARAAKLHGARSKAAPRKRAKQQS